MIQLAKKGRKVTGNEDAKTDHASECDPDDSDSTESLEVREDEKDHGSDQNEGIYMNWLEIMFLISAKKSIAESQKSGEKEDKYGVTDTGSDTGSDTDRDTDRGNGHGSENYNKSENEKTGNTEDKDCESDKDNDIESSSHIDTDSDSDRSSENDGEYGDTEDEDCESDKDSDIDNSGDIGSDSDNGGDSDSGSDSDDSINLELSSMKKKIKEKMDGRDGEGNSENKVECEVLDIIESLEQMMEEARQFKRKLYSLVTKLRKKNREMKRIDKEKKKRKIQEHLTLVWNEIFDKITEIKVEISEKNKVALLKNCNSGNITSEWLDILEDVDELEETLLKKIEEEVNDEFVDEDIQTYSWNEICEKGGKLLNFIRVAGKIEIAKAHELEMEAREKSKIKMFGNSEDTGKEIADDNLLIIKAITELRQFGVKF